MREREGILRIMRDAWKAPIFLRECILQSGVGDPPINFEVKHQVYNFLGSRWINK